MTERSAELGRWMAGAIQVGTVASVTFLLVGAALDLTTIAWYGLLLLTVTPALQLGVAAVAFGRGGERRYTLLTVVVLALLLAGLGVAALTGRGIGA